MTSGSDDTTFLAVGHCGPDTWMLKAAVERAADGGPAFESFDEEKALQARLAAGDDPVVLLVNRKLDGWFEATDGIELLSSVLATRRPRTATILVSDLADAQAAAEAAGARPGFGKRALNDPATLDALRNAATAATNA